jgi:hypothetical protein
MAKSKALKFLRTLLGWAIFLTLVGVPAVYFYMQEPVIDVTATTLKRGSCRGNSCGNFCWHG